MDSNVRRKENDQQGYNRQSGSRNLPSRMDKKRFIEIKSPSNFGGCSSDIRWFLFCDYVNCDENGYTELDKVWTAAKALCEEEVFVKVQRLPPAARALEMLNDSQCLTVLCFIQDNLDTESIMQSALKLRERIDFPFPIYLKRKEFNGLVYTNCNIFLHCPDGDLYTNNGSGWKYEMSANHIKTFSEKEIS